MPAAAPFPPPPNDEVLAVRRFNRFYTRRIGVLGEGLLSSPFSLAQVRVLYEIAHRDEPTATALRAELGLDRGYLSRMLSGFEARGLVRRRRSKADGRESLLSLTARGRRTFAPLDARSSEEVAAMIRALPPPRRRRLVRAMASIERLLDAPVQSAPFSPWRLRGHRPGDMGWVVHRHGVLYAREYGWDETFEALVAGIVSEFIENLDERRERCWIAEREGEILGSVFLVKKSERVAKLRLLYVEPAARGLGIGVRLVSECVDFARASGYERIVLWTQSVLTAARHIYEKAGFRIVDEQPNESFSKKLISETWKLDLKKEARTS
jgi:DNA-binding MarR family transcriptional regulator/N-acetylglutamate synthase-like GNAT family acetyltransferase